MSNDNLTNKTGEESIRVIDGEIFNDWRGEIASLNDFHFDGVKRCYVIKHPDPSVVRGWHGHQHERKWFTVIKGSFTIAIVKIDNWHNPSPDLKPEVFELSDRKSQLICVPQGHANCIKAHEPGSMLLVFSDVIVPDCYADSWRYPATNWIDLSDEGSGEGQKS